MIVQFPAPAQSVVVSQLEQALQLAREGKLSSLSMSYTTSDGDAYDCLEANDYHSALMLLGQTNMVRVDLIELVRRLRLSHAGR